MTVDYPGAIWIPAHPTNWRTYPNTPQGWVLHTPEEAADNNEVTPYYFQTPNLSASTHYYLDNDGDVYQMVPEKYSPIANGVKGKPYPSWANPNINLNSQSLNVEIEGRAASIGQTMPVGGVQFNALVKLIKHRCAAYGIPLDREHIIGHYQVSNDRSDPGATFPWAALMAELEDDMAERVWNTDLKQTWVVGKHGAAPVLYPAMDEPFKALYGEHTKAMSNGDLEKMRVK